MSTEIEECLRALADQWRARARRFMEEAEHARWSADMVRLTAMASTLEWAAGDLSWMARMPPLRRTERAGEAGPANE